MTGLQSRDEPREGWPHWFGDSGIEVTAVDGFGEQFTKKVGGQEGGERRGHGVADLLLILLFGATAFWLGRVLEGYAGSSD